MAPSTRSVATPLLPAVPGDPAPRPPRTPSPALAALRRAPSPPPEPPSAGRLHPRDVEALEVALLLEAVHSLVGHDFRGYAMPGLRRRVRRRVHEEDVRTVSGLQEKVVHDEAAMRRLVQGLSVTTTSMFRDPGFFRSMRDHVAPMLRTYPALRIWHAGCSSGEEVYSMAILLEEEGLHQRSLIYATDIHDALLERAERGVFELEACRRWETDYRMAGGKGSLADYYRPRGRQAVFDAGLRRNIVFAPHNLATDASFNEFNVILCRHVLIYFGAPLQQRAHRVLYDSLARFGFLGLGRRETMDLSPHGRQYQVVDAVEKLYRKVA